MIYYYYNETVPIFLPDLFAKNEKDNLTNAERNDLCRIVSMIVETYGTGT